MRSFAKPHPAAWPPGPRLHPAGHTSNCGDQPNNSHPTNGRMPGFHPIAVASPGAGSRAGLDALGRSIAG